MGFDCISSCLFLSFYFSCIIYLIGSATFLTDHTVYIVFLTDVVLRAGRAWKSIVAVPGD